MLMYSISPLNFITDQVLRNPILNFSRQKFIGSNQVPAQGLFSIAVQIYARVFYIFTLIIEERWIEFDFLIRETDKWFGHDWDKAEPDDGDTRKIIEMILTKKFE